MTEKDLQKFDYRTLKLRKELGQLNDQDQDKHIASLPDEEDNLEYVVLEDLDKPEELKFSSTPSFNPAESNSFSTTGIEEDLINHSSDDSNENQNF